MCHQQDELIKTQLKKKRKKTTPDKFNKLSDYRERQVIFLVIIISVTIATRFFNLQIITMHSKNREKGKGTLYYKQLLRTEFTSLTHFFSCIFLVSGFTGAISDKLKTPSIKS